MKILENIYNFLLLFILFINFFCYFFKYIYFKLNKKNFKKLLNKLLPIVSKYNRPLLLFGLIPLFIDTISLIIAKGSLNILDILFILIYLALVANFRNISNTFDYRLKKTSSYLIILVLIIKIIL